MDSVGSETGPGWDLEVLALWEDFNAIGTGYNSCTLELEGLQGTCPGPFYRWGS